MTFVKIYFWNVYTVPITWLSIILYCMFSLTFYVVLSKKCRQFNITYILLIILKVACFKNGFNCYLLFFFSCYKMRFCTEIIVGQILLLLYSYVSFMIWPQKNWGNDYWFLKYSSVSLHGSLHPSLKTTHFDQIWDRVASLSYLFTRIPNLNKYVIVNYWCGIFLHMATWNWTHNGFLIVSPVNYWNIYCNFFVLFI